MQGLANEIFALKSTDTCESKFLFRYDACLNSKVFMSVGETKFGRPKFRETAHFFFIYGSPASTESTSFPQDTEGGTYCC